MEETPPTPGDGDTPATTGPTDTPASRPRRAEETPAEPFGKDELQASMTRPLRVLDVVLGERKRMVANVRSARELRQLIYVLLLCSVVFAIPFAIFFALAAPTPSHAEWTPSAELHFRAEIVPRIVDFMASFNHSARSRRKPRIVHSAS